MFSPSSASFGWKFPRAKVLDPDLGLASETLHLKYCVNLLTQENDANALKESTPILKNHSTLESRLVRSWMLENFITGGQRINSIILIPFSQIKQWSRF